MASVSLTLTCQKSLAITWEPGRGGGVGGGGEWESQSRGRGRFSALTADKGEKEKKKKHTKLHIIIILTTSVGDVRPLLSGIVGEPLTRRGCQPSCRRSGFSERKRKRKKKSRKEISPTKHSIGLAGAPLPQKREKTTCSSRLRPET